MQASQDLYHAINDLYWKPTFLKEMPYFQDEISSQQPTNGSDWDWLKLYKHMDVHRLRDPWTIKRLKDTSEGER